MINYQNLKYMDRPLVTGPCHNIISCFSSQVAVEGNIGSGKSTFLQYFRDSQNVEVASEPVDLWKNVRGHNTLVSQLFSTTSSITLV